MAPSLETVPLGAKERGRKKDHKLPARQGYSMGRKRTRGSLIGAQISRARKDVAIKNPNAQEREKEIRRGNKRIVRQEDKTP